MRVESMAIALSDRIINHAIVFGLPVKSKKLVQSAWGLGFTYIGSVSCDSINYVTSYIQKKLYGMNQYVGVLPPFSLMSKGLGLRYCLDNKSVLEESDSLVYRGKKISVPRYFVKKLGLDKYNSYIRLSPIADKLGFDSKYIIGHNPYLLSACVYTDKRVLGSLHQLNLRLRGAYRSKKND